MKALSRSAMSAASLVSSPAVRSGSPWMLCANMPNSERLP